MVIEPKLVDVVPERPYRVSWSILTLKPFVSIVSPPVLAVATPQIPAVPTSLKVAFATKT